MKSEQQPLLLPSDELESVDFDLVDFFGTIDHESIEDSSLHFAEETQGKKVPDLLVTLRENAKETMSTFSKNVTADTFTAGAALTSGVFSALGSLVGSCGVLCTHALGSLGQAGSGMAAMSPFGGMRSPNFSVDTDGSFHLDGTVDELSSFTGISKERLRSGQFSTQEILSSFLSVFGRGMHHIFGFGLIECVIGCLIPVPKLSEQSV